MRISGVNNIKINFGSYYAQSSEQTQKWADKEKKLCEANKQACTNKLAATSSQIENGKRKAWNDVNMLKNGKRQKENLTTKGSALLYTRVQLKLVEQNC